ncbi:MAG: hypothetical protein E7E73_00210 [Negativicoccus succinicivorans]|nr:hypothetical protein [Negativicoccus succinicivorans]
MLKDYGASELKKYAIENVLEKKPKTIGELTEIAFDRAYDDGTLTFSDARAQKEILEEYTLSEAYKELQDMGFTESVPDVGAMHIIFAENKFADEMAKYVSPYMPRKDMTDSEKIFAGIYKLSVDNNLGFEKEPAIKEAYLKGEMKNEQETTSKLVMSKPTGKGLER